MRDPALQLGFLILVGMLLLGATHRFTSPSTEIDYAMPAVEEGSVQELVLTGRLSLNAATGDSLSALPGVGPITAARILDWRKVHGPFNSAADLAHIPGISTQWAKQLSPYLY